LFSRAEDKVKLSDDEIEQACTRSATVVHLYFTRSAILSAFCRTNRLFEFHKRSQLFIRTHNKALSFVVVCICNPDYSPLQSTAATQPNSTGFAPNRTSQIAAEPF